MSAVMTTSCLEDKEDETTIGVELISTLKHLDSGEMIAFVDGGGTARMTASSVANIEQKAGKSLSGVERAIVYCSYDPSYAVQDTLGFIHATQATLNGVVSIPVDSVLYASVPSDSAAINLALDPDSLDVVNCINNLYFFGGYMNIDYTAVCYPYVAPAATVINDSVKENKAYFTLCFNDHNAGTNQSQNYYLYSYRLDDLNVPGNDSIQMFLSTQGLKQVSVRIARRDLKKLTY